MEKTDYTVTSETQVMTRTKAKNLGLPRYFSGRPCPSGHLSYRWTSSTACCECQDHYVEQYRSANRERFREYSQQYRDANRDDSREYMKLYMREYRQKKKLEARAKAL